MLNSIKEATEAVNEGEDRLVSSEQVLAYLEELPELLNTGTPSERRTVLTSFVKEVILEEETVTVHFSIPMPAKQIRLNSLPVLKTVTNGGDAGTRTRTLLST